MAQVLRQPRFATTANSHSATPTHALTAQLAINVPTRGQRQRSAHQEATPMATTCNARFAIPTGQNARRLAEETSVHALQAPTESPPPMKKHRFASCAHQAISVPRAQKQSNQSNASPVGMQWGPEIRSAPRHKSMKPLLTQTQQHTPVRQATSSPSQGVEDATRSTQ